MTTTPNLPPMPKPAIQNYPSGQWSYHDAQMQAYALAAYQAGMSANQWQSIETAPKDRPILAYCNHEADPYTEDGGKTLTLYAAQAEGMSHAETGFHIVEWGGAWDDRSYEEPNAGHMPDWWFVKGSDFEVAANPTHWMPLLEPPTAQPA